MAIRVSGRNWPAAVAVALSAGSLAASLTGCSAAAQAATTAAPAAATATAPGWRVVATPGAADLADGLAASGTSNAWVSEVVCPVGKCADLTGLAGRQLRWNGTAWRFVTFPKAYQGGTVIPVSPVSDWIIGAIPVSKNASRDAVLHWTGRGAGKATLLGKNVSIGTGVAPGGKGAWLFGSTYLGGPDDSPYALHYASGGWRPVRVPFVGQGASASTPANVWVSGYRPSDDSAGVMAFNGKKWRSVPLPPLPSSLVYTGDGNIAVAGQKSVWLEIERTSDAAHSTPYLLHWTGSKWTSIKIPYNLDDTGTSVAQDGQGGVWLSMTDLTHSVLSKAYLVHYLHGRWTRIAVPATAGYQVPDFVSLAWIPGTRSLWAAAVEQNPRSLKSQGRLLLLKYGH